MDAKFLYTLVEPPDDDKNLFETYVGVSDTRCKYIYLVHWLVFNKPIIFWSKIKTPEERLIQPTQWLTQTSDWVCETHNAVK
jgi:hypothetical protein